jgi:methionyl-tRNA synthetase
LGGIRLRDGLSKIIDLSVLGNRYFQENEPWRGGKRAKTVLYLCMNLCRTLAILISPYLPKSSSKLWGQLNLEGGLSWDGVEELKLSPGHKINKPEILFKKLEQDQINQLKERVTKVTPLKSFFGKGVVSLKDFERLDMRVGRVLSAEQIPGSKNLIKMVVDFGTERKQAVAGLLRWYSPQKLVGRIFSFVVNLRPTKVMGVESNCMILAVDDGRGNVVLLQPEREIEIGTKIR